MSNQGICTFKNTSLERRTLHILTFNRKSMDKKSTAIDLSWILFSPVDKRMSQPFYLYSTAPFPVFPITITLGAGAESHGNSSSFFDASISNQISSFSNLHSQNSFLFERVFEYYQTTFLPIYKPSSDLNRANTFRPSSAPCTFLPSIFITLSVTSSSSNLSPPHAVSAQD